MDDRLAFPFAQIALVTHCKIYFFFLLLISGCMPVLILSCRTTISTCSHPAGSDWTSILKKKKKKDLKTYRHQTALTPSSSKEPCWPVTRHRASLWFNSCFFLSFFVNCVCSTSHFGVTCCPKLKAAGQPHWLLFLFCVCSLPAFKRLRGSG